MCESEQNSGVIPDTCRTNTDLNRFPESRIASIAAKLNLWIPGKHSSRILSVSCHRLRCDRTKEKSQQARRVTNRLICVTQYEEFLRWADRLFSVLSMFLRIRTRRGNHILEERRKMNRENSKQNRVYLRWKYAKAQGRLWGNPGGVKRRFFNELLQNGACNIEARDILDFGRGWLIV